jgi:hypothetical protein
VVEKVAEKELTTLTRIQILAQIRRLPRNEQLRLLEDFAALLRLELLQPEQETDERGWPIGYFERTAGSLSEFPMERPAQMEFQERDNL